MSPSPVQGRLSLKTRWLIWRARLSAPALLARFDECKVVSAVAAFNGGLAILTIGLFAWVTDLPLVFPALGPSAFILFRSPMSPEASPRCVILGHLTGMACGYATWKLLGAMTGTTVSMQLGGSIPYFSASLALGATCLCLVRFSCPHPPACASAIVVALGGVTQLSDLLIMALAVVWVAVQAVAMNRLAGLPVPAWQPRDRAAL
jgi:CBS-domain-containing membrane protein